MRTTSLLSVLLVVVVTSSIHAQLPPVDNPVTPPTTTTTPATASALSVPARLLRIARQELAKMAPNFSVIEDLAAVAEGQGEVKDIEGLRMTVAIIEQTVEATEVRFRPTVQFMLSKTLAGAFARAGDMESYRATLVKPGGATAESYADAKDYAAMYKAADAEPVARQAILYLALAERLAGTDPAEAREAMKRAEQRVSAASTYEPQLIVLGYAKMGDVDTAFKKAESLKAEDPFHIYEGLADVFDKAGNHSAARRAKETFVNAVLKAPAEKRDIRLFYVFTRQMEMGDTKGAEISLKLIKAHADELPKRENTNWKSSFYMCAAQAAARLGDQRQAADYAESALNAGDWDADMRGVVKRQYEDDIIAARAYWLAAQGQGDDAAASIAAIKDANRRLIGLRKLILAAAIADDERTAVAALNKLDDPTERLSQIPIVAQVLVWSDAARRKAGPDQKGWDPEAWVKSFTAAGERVVAARSAAMALSRRSKHGAE